MTKNVGKVYLVGAGPGDAGLLTLRGLECLKLADLVLYDGLVNPLLLRHTAGVCERTSRATSQGGRKVGQDEVNTRLIEAALSGQTVVRLKGGDPFIFGRGSEEAAALGQHDIPFEVVPGITAATAAGVYAGISLTHRELSSCVAFITGHEDPTKPASMLDYANLASFTGTLVFYMGLHRLPQIATALIENGKSPTTPACVISKASTPLQKTVYAPLGELPAAAAAANLRPPSLIIVGECVTQRESIGWFEQRPLLGQRIAITRPAHQADDAVRMALELGAAPIVTPLIEILPPQNWDAVDIAIQDLPLTDWLVFSSANAVRSFLDRMLAIGLDMRMFGCGNIAAIGRATANALRTYHLVADLVPKGHSSEDLAADLQDKVSDKNVMWVSADRSRQVLSEKLSSHANSFTQVAAYRNRDVENVPQAIVDGITDESLEWITLSSPAIARRLADLLPPELLSKIGKTTKLASISPLTTSAARKAGLAVECEAAEAIWPAIFDAIVASG